MSDSDLSRAKFARIWRGRTRRNVADSYERYWLERGVKPLQAKGALAVQMLRDDRAEETEFVTISWWESLEAMAPEGGDPHRTHHLDRDPEFLMEVPDRVQVLRVLESHGV